MAANDVQRALELEQQKAYTRIPNFFGDPNSDYFKPEEWITRVDNNRTSANWTDPQTMTIIFNALRGKALTWHMVMKQRGIPGFDTWAVYKTLFLEAFSAARTSKAVVGIFHGLNQQPKESVLEFFNRVGKATDDMTTLRPALPNPVAANWTEAFQAIEGWGAFDAANKTAQGLAFMRIGATRTMEHVSVQLFIAGLKSNIREQILAQAPNAGYDNLWTACQAALEVEKNIKEPTIAIKLLQPTGAAVHAADATPESNSTNNEPQYSEEEVALMRKYPNLFRGRTRGRGGPRGRGQRGGSSSNNSGRNGKCYNCNEEGHWARNCPKPKRDRNRPKVSAAEAADNKTETGNNQSDQKEAAEVEYQPFSIPPPWGPVYGWSGSGYGPMSP